MSEPQLISPMLDNFIMGDPISNHDGVRSCPAVEQKTQDKYIVKIISTPASASQLDALLLSGAYADKSEALAYFEELTKGIEDEIAVLDKLSTLEGFIGFDMHQTVPMDDGNGFDVYLLGTYKLSLDRYFSKNTVTHLSALNLGMDLCSALSICRRSGYLYVNLKPENIYLTTDNGYRIGDIGFIKLDSLKYASLPNRYRSAYTAPEIQDAFSSLNATIDIYAAGLILYQAYNGGELPELSAPTSLSAPAYADTEMAEIILKACSPDPAARWQDPVEMGQAIVSYIQRNGANDTPIVPIKSHVADDPESKGIFEGPEPEKQPDDAAESHAADADDAVDSEDVPSPADEIVLEEPEALPEVAEDSVYTEDDFGNLTFMVDDAQDVDNSEALLGGLEYEQVSVEVSEILAQADDLLSHPTPAPVISPEPIDVPIPPLPIVQEEDAGEPSDHVDPDRGESVDAEKQDEPLPVSPTESALTDEEEESPIVKKPKRHWIRNSIILVLLLALLAAGIYYYQNYYLQPIESIVLDGSETELTVCINSKIDDSLLTVICADTYGNQLQSAVTDGKAVFSNLTPNSAYTVKVLVSGFHRLTGKLTASYTTPARTNITDFVSVTGQTDGSVILRFTIAGPDSGQWKVTYSAPGEAEKERTFSGHMVEIPDLTVGSNYTFTLSSVDKLYCYGTNQITHIASKLILAEDLHVISRYNGKLTVSWTAPQNATVGTWNVRCSNSKGYDKSIVTSQPTAVFDGIVEQDSYTIEVIASGMSVGQRTHIAENTQSVYDFVANSSAGDKAILSWISSSNAPNQQWILQYALEGTNFQESLRVTENSAQIPPLVPGATYHFTLLTSQSEPVIGGSLIYNVPNANDFNAYWITKDYIELNMCFTPSEEDWDRFDLDQSSFSTTFSVGQKASFLIRLRKDYNTSTDAITTMYVIRDNSGKIISTATETRTWNSIWNHNYGEFDIPALPDTPGSYVVAIYFNGASAGEQTFTVTA